MEPDRITRLDQFTHVLSLASEDGGQLRSHQVAGGGARFLSGAIDLAIQITAFAVMVWLALTGRPDLFPPESWFWAGPVAFIEWHIIYLMLFESFTRGQTPGKALLGIRVVTTAGELPRPLAFIIRNVARLVDLLLGGYVGSLLLLNKSSLRQRMGDIAAHTVVVYRAPLSQQLESARVPHSLYSTSEDGYLLEAWIEREGLMDEESRVASSVDLAAYLHTRYSDGDTGETGAIAYLRELYDAEQQHSTED